MIETATNSVNLKALEELLQKRLLSESLSIIPLQISCLLREATLMILAHYPEAALPNPKEIFPCLRQILEEEEISRHYQIQMYLIVHEQYQLEANKTAFKIQNLKFKIQNRIIPKFSLVIAGTGIGIALGFCILYTLTRPCVVGQCQSLSQAQQLKQEASTIYSASSSESNLRVARQKLTQAIEILQAIPGWSNYYNEAQKQLYVYQVQLAKVESIIIAIKVGEKASVLAKNLPLPLTQWQEIQQTLQNAIAALEKLSSQSELSAFTQIRLQEYHRNLARAEQNLKAEQQAMTSLKSAQQAAKVAKMRFYSAQSFADWELVYATWQAVIKELREIPSETTSYQGATQLLDTYTPQLAIARSRKDQEQFALNLYHQAITQAELAKKAALINQWSVAVTDWRKAIVYLQQIPKTTFLSSQTQPLITTYTQEFKQAEIKLKEVIKIQKIRNELDKTCIKVNKICHYIISDKVIKVNLTSAYIQQVWQVAVQAKATANLQTQVELLNHLSILEQSLQKISNQSEKQVIVYNSTGEIVASYEPIN